MAKKASHTTIQTQKCSCYNLRTRNFLLKWPKIVSHKNYLITWFCVGLAPRNTIFPKKMPKRGVQKTLFLGKNCLTFFFICFRFCLLAIFDSATELLPLFLLCLSHFFLSPFVSLSVSLSLSLSRSLSPSLSISLFLDLSSHLFLPLISLPLTISLPFFVLSRLSLSLYLCLCFLGFAFCCFYYLFFSLSPSLISFCFPFFLSLSLYLSYSPSLSLSLLLSSSLILFSLFVFPLFRSLSLSPSLFLSLSLSLSPSLSLFLINFRMFSLIFSHSL